MNEGIKVSNFERIPLKNRLAFQLVLMKMMLGENSTHELQNEWADNYSVRVSSIIDNTENGFIRELIINGTQEKYTEASGILIKILSSDEKGKAA